MYLCNDLASEVRVLASEAFNRSWHFIEIDPALAGEDRDKLQNQLAELILLFMRSGERNLIVIANRAIATLRRQTRRDGTDFLWKTPPRVRNLRRSGPY